ncbi:hypothetical protein GCM10018793_61060 [Streptomyces sulfonofaciens]|uniref:Uncharacterized protein n=1 Tax=Streptomyces sulfonofaciens TaxID=68272 RepID=A0A919GNM6_9ACTN|nr:hypothetical protein [Streptomyces sulfonofaciens]GHH87000.1 hypothetical protein GCM10018793_61060 [Streptomyces sulfonofaciens]
MPEMDASRVSRRDGDGREHTVRVQRTGARRVIECETCGWHRPAQFLPWLKAEEHLAQTHRATVDAAGEAQEQPER